MVRSAAAVVAALILPASAHAQEPEALAQEPEGTHTVVTGDTLWDLSQYYYQDPFEWRVIWNANREVVEDPNWIYPDEVFRIPGLPADAEEEAPAETPAEPPEETPMEPAEQPPAMPTAPRRSVFYRDTTETMAVVRGSEAAHLAVAPDAVYSAPWLIRVGEEPEYSGVLEGFATRGERGSTIRSYQLVRVDTDAPVRVGDRLQLFRITRTIEDVGQVAAPTGVVRVSALEDGAVVGTVTKEYARVQPGDLVRPLPTYPLEPGQYAQAITGGSEAMVMGFAEDAALNALGRIAFLDLGSDDGVTIGDEFILYGIAIETNEEGSLQVVGVTETMASARILSLADDVFRQGVVVRLARKMR